jgi:hypothetical protein
VGWDGWLAGAGLFWQNAIRSPIGQTLRLPGVLARTRAFNRVKLTPEGIPFAELRQVTESMLKAGYRVFNFTYHSPSLSPGHTPYVRSAAELDAFVGCIERYLEFFFGRCNGVAATPHLVRELCDKPTSLAA